jgi:predicted Zn-dependent peptidase
MQEIVMGEDQLDELIFDEYLLRSLPKHELGRSILGTEHSLKAMTQAQVKKYYKSQYCGKNLIVAAAGNIDHEELVQAVRKKLGQKSKRQKVKLSKKPKHKPFRAAIEKQTEQLHLLMGLPCPSFKDKDRFEAFIVNALLGGGMTSRLYQSVREKKGLVYTVYSSLNTFKDFGLINIYAASEVKNMKSVIKTIFTELKKAKRMGITEADLKLFKTQVVGSLLLGADDIENRMQSIAVNEMVFEKYKPVEEIVEEINQVSVKSVNKFIREKFDFSQMGAILMGGGAEELKEWFINEA